MTPTRHCLFVCLFVYSFVLFCFVLFCSVCFVFAFAFNYNVIIMFRSVLKALIILHKDAPYLTHERSAGKCSPLIVVCFSSYFTVPQPISKFLIV